MGKLIIYTNKDIASSFDNETTAITVLLGGDSDKEWMVPDTNYQLIVNSIQYEKEMYKPCALTIACTCSEKVEQNNLVKGPDTPVTDPDTPVTDPDTPVTDPDAPANETVTTTLPQALKHLFFSEKDTSGNWNKAIMKVDVAAAKEDKTLFYVAKNYYVHSFKLEKKVVDNQTSYTVTLTCFSPDKRLTLDKYCEVYSAKRFGARIFKKELMDRFGFTEDEISYDVTRLNLLKYTKEGVVRELVQPYLVQYNESFYDFLCRVANRCGEFLYYRDGKICLGLPGEASKALSDTVICSYPEVSESGLFGITVSPFAENYVDETKPSADNAVYKARITYDETLHRLTEGDGETLSWFDTWDLFGLMATFLAGDSLTGCISDTAEEAGVRVATMPYVKSQIEKSYKKDYLDKYQDNMGLSTSGDKDFQFLNEFYYNIRKGEEEASRGKVELNFSNALPTIDLGDEVTLPDGLADKYIVTRIAGTFSDKDDQISHSAEVIPVGDYPITTISVDGEAVDVTVSILPPPHGSIIREADPQEAIVEETDDPLFMGRVRIRYVWQTKQTSDKAVSKIEDSTDFEDGVIIATSLIDNKDNNNNDNSGGTDNLGGTGQTEEKGNGTSSLAMTDDETVNTDGETVNTDGSNGTPENNNASQSNAADTTTESSYALSPWIRMVVPFAGGDGGFLMTPTKGDHVMVNYEGRNVDCPYVEGSLFHQEMKPNPGSISMSKGSYSPSRSPRVISSPNGHCICFSDGKGVTGFWGGMIPPLQQLVLNPLNKVLKFDKEPSALNGGITLTDTNGIYEIAMSTAGRSVSIGSPFGKVDISAFTGIEISAPNGDIKISGKNITLEAGNNIVLSSGKNILDKDDAPSGKNTVGLVGSFLGSVAKGAGKFYLKEFTGIDITKLTDVKFLRSLWEVLFRPVEGTLQIQSKRNVVMTAGVGKVSVPSSLLSAVGRVGKLPSVKELTAKKYEDSKFNRYKSLLVKLQKTSDVFIDKTVYVSYEKLLRDINMKVDSLMTMTTVTFTAVVDHQVLQDWVKDSKENTKKQFINNLINKVAFPEADQVVAKNDKATNEEKRWRKQANKGFKGFASKYKKLQDDFTALLTNTTDGTQLLEKLKATADPLKKLTPDDTEELKFELPEATDFAADFAGYDFSQAATWENPADKANWPIALTKRKIAIKLIMKVITSADAFEIDKPHSEAEMVADEQKWKEYAASIKVKKEKDEKLTFKTGAKLFGIEAFNAFAGDFVQYDEEKGWKGPSGIQKLLNWDGSAGPRALWDVSQGGNILLSNSKSFTYKLNEDSKGWTPMVNPTFMALRDYLENLFSGSAFIAIE